MENKLQNIKDEIAKIDNFHNWDGLFESCAMYDYGRLDKAINEIAIRYAQEQNRELVANIQLLIQSLDYDALGVMSGLIIEDLKELLTKYNHLNQM